ncbi:MAG TPA: fibronectin type III domain-containing protein [Thermoanaerobaculia bacterium]
MSKRRIPALFVCCLFATAAFAVNAPSNLVANATSNSSITLTWTDNSTDEIGFTFMFDTNSSFTNPGFVWTGGANVVTYAHGSRGSSTTYYYRIKAEGSTDALDSGWTATAAATTAPSALSATPASDTQVNLSWSGNSSNTSISGYTVAMNSSASHSGASYQYVSGAGTTTLSKTNLTPNTTYYFAVKAEGTSGTYDSPFTPWVSATTPNPTPGISAHFFGVNAWMPYQIGPHVFYGSLDNHWTNIQNSGAKIMRYGGNGPDQYADPSWVDPSDPNKSTLKQYLALVNNMQSRGIEPVLQVPVYGTTYDANDAAAIVQYINVTHLKNVKYWSIGNEPDLQSGAYAYTTAAQVANYFKPIASAMKAVDPTIKIIGPDTAWYNETIINGLTTCGGAYDITGTDSNGRYYIDIISFHHYNNFSGSQDRNAVIGTIMGSGGLNEKLGYLSGRVQGSNQCWNRTGSNALKMALTEANVNYANSSNDGPAGTGAMSFVGGQWWAEALGVAMKHGVDFVTFWSTIEGNQLGFISSDGNTKRPSYYHFQMMAQNFRGNVVNTADTQSLVKTFASKASDQTAVIIMNQSNTTSYPYTVRLDMSPASGTNALKVNVDAGLAIESSGTIGTESTLLLVFDASGVLKKKIIYTQSNATSNQAPTVTNY